MTAAYFCIGTEFRFLANKLKQNDLKKDGEMYHAKSLHIATTFLPGECPMVDHVKKAYLKHHLVPKLEHKKATLSQPDEGKEASNHRSEHIHPSILEDATRIVICACNPQTDIFPNCHGHSN